MPNFIHRDIIQQVSKQMRKFPVLALTGPRQSGKTTLLKNIFQEYEYLSLENPDNRAFAIEDPNGFLKKYDNNVILDEVQRVPKLFSYLQSKVDESQKMGQYILSGSQNFQLMQNITQTLAGRIALFKLLPLSFSELKNINKLNNSFSKTCLNGFYPAVFDRKIDAKIFYSNYLSSYVEKDITDLVNIQNINTFRKFIGLCANNVGQLLNLNSLAKSAGISHTTARAWLSLLESSFILFLLQPYHNNFKKRLVKSPKIYFYDTGLLCHLLKLSDAKELETNRLKGNIFKNLVVAEFQKQNLHNCLYRDYYFWRDSNGHEVDLMFKDKKDFRIVEMKATETIRSDLFKQMDYFDSISDFDRLKKMLIYSGEDNQKRTKYDIVSWLNMSD